MEDTFNHKGELLVEAELSHEVVGRAATEERVRRAMAASRAEHLTFVPVGPTSRAFKRSAEP